MLTIQNPDTFDWAGMSLVDCARGNAVDSYFTFKIYKLLKDKIKERHLLLFYEKLTAPATKLFSEIEYSGMDVDTSKIDKLDKEIKRDLDAIEDSIYALREVDKTLNIGSTQQLVEVLYSLKKDSDKKYIEVPKGFHIFPVKISDSDNASTDEESLDIITDLLEKEIANRKLHE